ncbi:hypothetical protein EVG20_g10964 [Dentipellis fragilis]|uniref:Uracil-DNA glycosylase-like domain-containing protein n=1 Tax=Dentipellis fragilis TaxID=205917 RepID=A0A4Y9XP60_9AGAM|nr:hypothetical protein EVG20_g10964 [Dentipellis fragilis]
MPLVSKPPFPQCPYKCFTTILIPTPQKVETKAVLCVNMMNAIAKGTLPKRKLVAQNGRLVSVSTSAGQAASSSSSATSDPTETTADAPRKRSKVVKEANESEVEREDVQVLLTSAVQALETLEKDTMHASWYEALKDEFKKPYFGKLKEFLKEEHKAHTVYPPLRDVYSWSRLTPLDKVKVVVIGQVGNPP